MGGQLDRTLLQFSIIFHQILNLLGQIRVFGFFSAIDDNLCLFDKFAEEIRGDSIWLSYAIYFLGVFDCKAFVKETIGVHFLVTLFLEETHELLSDLTGLGVVDEHAHFWLWFALGQVAPHFGKGRVEVLRFRDQL